MIRKSVVSLVTILLVYTTFGNCFAATSDYYPPHDIVYNSRAIQNMPQPLTIDTVKQKALIAELDFNSGDSSDTLTYSYTKPNDTSGVSVEGGVIKVVKTEENKVATTQVVFRYNGEVTAGAHYAFTCRIKCEGVVNQTGGPRNLIEAYGTKDGEKNKWLSQSLIYDGHKYEEGNTDWYTVCQMLQAPENTEFFNLSAYVNSNTTGTIYFDDFKLYKVAIDPLESVLITPNYKGLIFEESNADIELDVLLEESEFYPFGNMMLEVKLVDDMDNIVRYASADILSKKMKFTFSSEGLSLGEYYLQTILKDARSGEIISFKEHTIRRTDAYPETYLNEKGNLIRYGETKFFKKIMSHNGQTAGTTYREVAEDALSADIDSISHYGMWWLLDNSSVSSALEYMRENGLKNHLTVAGYWWGNYGERANMFETFVEKQEDILPFLTKIANNYKDDTVLDGYYVFDEPYPVYEGDEIRWNNEILAQADINHPTFGVADKDFDRYGIYTKMTDILGVDPYPIYGRETDNIARVGQVVREAKANFPNRPVYLVLQCFNWGTQNNDATMRSPNLTELKNIAWQGICEGAVGLDAFSYPSMKNDTTKSFDEWWSDLTTVYSEVEEYGDVIMSEEPSPLYSVSRGGEWLNILVKRYQGNTYVFAVNNTKEEKSATLTIKGLESQELFFEPLEVKILTIAQDDYLSPEAHLKSFQVYDGEVSFPIADVDDKKVIFLPEGTNAVDYASKVSDGAKLYINGEEMELCGTLNINREKRFTVTVVAQNGITSNSETYEVYVEAKPGAYVHKSQSYVAVVGNAGVNRANTNVTLMLVNKEADLENIEKGDIAYITQKMTNRDGSYSFEFGFSGFTFDNDGNVDNYMIILNANGVRISDTISEAKAVSELVSFDLDMSQEGKSIVNMANPFKLQDLGYTLFIGFYDDQKLLDVKRYDKFTGDSNIEFYNTGSIPAGTTFVKGFLWDTSESMIPIAPSQTKELDSSDEQNSHTE